MKFVGIFIAFVFTLAAWNIIDTNQSNKVHRLPAQGKIDHQISQELLKIKNITSFQNANTILGTIEANLNKKESQNAKAVATLVRMLRESEGILSKVENVVEKSTATSIGIIAELKALKQSTSAEHKHVHILIDRLFLPVNKNQKYDDVEEVQIAIRDHVIPKLIEAHTQLKNNLKNYPINNGIVELFEVDTQTLAGAAAKFIPKERRSFTVNSAHLYIGKVELERLIGYAYYMISYDLHKYGELMRSAAKSTAKKAGLTDIVHSQTYKESNRLTKMSLHAKAQKDYYSQTLTLHSWALKQNTLNSSRQWYLKSFDSVDDAIIIAKQAKSQSDQFSISDKLINKYAKKSQDHAAMTRKFLSATSPVNFVHPINGMTFKIHPGQIFNGSNGNIAHLTNLFPIAHDKRSNVTVDGHKLLNLNYGQSTKWRDISFGGVLPDATETNIHDQLRALSSHPATKDLANWLSFFH